MPNALDSLKFFSRCPQILMCIFVLLSNYGTRRRVCSMLLLSSCNAVKCILLNDGAVGFYSVPGALSCFLSKAENNSLVCCHRKVSESLF